MTKVISVPDDGDPEAVLNAISRWTRDFFELMEAALAWRFSPLRNCPSKQRIRQELDRSYERIVAYLNQPAEVLDRRHRYQRRYTFTARWVMWHLLEHKVHHRAQIFSYMRMNGIPPPQI